MLLMPEEDSDNILHTFITFCIRIMKKIPLLTGLYHSVKENTTLEVEVQWQANRVLTTATLEEPLSGM